MTDIKLIAMYLPQYHKVVENEKWWGKGFTDWTAVRNAKSLFENHEQPKKPYKDNYYDLLEKNTLVWQMNLMKKYNVYGLSFYHYWFKDGQRILEKPAENLLKWTDIDIPFCFTWANESWARTWSNISNKNTWADIYEQDNKDCNKQFLLEQKYGDEKSWKEHFDYLLPFFMDQRYIKVDGKPVINIYKPELIFSLPRMIRYWRKLASNVGLNGLYIIGMNSRFDIDSLDAFIVHEPGYTMLNNPYLKSRDNDINVFDYDEIWEEIIKREYDQSKKIYCGGFVNFDDTPRRGKHGCVVKEGTADKFTKYMKKLVNKNLRRGNEFVFINAWNEWGEGMYLEPDYNNKFAFLDAIKQVMQVAWNNTPIHAFPKGTSEAIINNEIGLKYEKYYKLLHQWLLLREEGKKLTLYLKKYGYNRIAIYGMGELAHHFINELKDGNIDVVYAIDRDTDKKNCGVPVVSLKDDLSKVDAVIVTPIFDFYKIESNLRKLVVCPIISLEEVVFES